MIGVAIAAFAIGTPFVVTGLGTGSVTAEMDRGGPRLTGAFHFDTTFFNPAEVTATYDLARDTLVAGATRGDQGA